MHVFIKRSSAWKRDIGFKVQHKWNYELGQKKESKVEEAVLNMKEPICRDITQKTVFFFLITWKLNSKNNCAKDLTKSDKKVNWWNRSFIWICQSVIACDVHKIFTAVGDNLFRNRKFEAAKICYQKAKNAEFVDASEANLIKIDAAKVRVWVFGALPGPTGIARCAQHDVWPSAGVRRVGQRRGSAAFIASRLLNFASER